MSNVALCPGQQPVGDKPKPVYVDCIFENASPVWYDVDKDNVLQIHLVYDHERDSPNRASGHFHFCINGTAGQSIRFELNNLDNVWNSSKSSLAKELKAAVVSDDGKEWESISLDTTPDGRVFGTVQLHTEKKYIARIEPYRLSDLDRMMARIASHPLVNILPIGGTVEGRSLELIRIGADNARYQVFFRARSHPWEAGGNWIVEGILERLLTDDATMNRLLQDTSFFILPMANKDGVARGRTRFNSAGMDLNRNWNQPASPKLLPENAALENWLEARLAAGQKIDLAIELHNDGNGKLHVSRPPGVDLKRHISRMELLESLLKRYTWFTEGSTSAGFRNAGTLGEGWLMRYDIDAVVHEFNCNIIAGLGERPLAKHWKAYGNQLPSVIEDYLKHRQD